MTSIYHFSSGKCLYENVPQIVTVEQKMFYKTGAMSLKFIHIKTNRQLHCTSAVSITHLQPDTSTVGMFFVRRALEECDVETNCTKVCDEASMSTITMHIPSVESLRFSAGRL
jgi:hypothetical protein